MSKTMTPSTHTRAYFKSHVLNVIDCHSSEVMNNFVNRHLLFDSSQKRTSWVPHFSASPMYEQKKMHFFPDDLLKDICIVKSWKIVSLRGKGQVCLLSSIIQVMSSLRQRTGLLTAHYKISGYAKLKDYQLWIKLTPWAIFTRGVSYYVDETWKT
jgi:hypothetical protein